MAKIVTITNPLTGQPAQVDQLDHTAQQIDDGLNIARGVSNPNLLDNWYFGNPVDQRQGRIVKPNTTYYSDNQLTTSAGTTSAYVTAYRYATGTASGVSYASFKLTDSDTAPTYYAAPENVVRGYIDDANGGSIDRWHAPGYSNQAICIMTDCIRLKSTGDYGRITQKIPADITQYIKDKTVTISLLTKNTNPLMTVTSAFNTMAGGISLNFDFKIYTKVLDDGTSSLCLHQIGNNAYTDILAVKLELGSKQTLAHQENGVWVLNEIPDFGEQLRRCQRYFWRSWTGDRNIQKSILGVVFANNTRITGFDYPVEMRTRPSITVYGLTGANKVTFWDNDDDYGPASPVYWDAQRCMALACDGAGLSNDNRVYYFIEANAEL